jgi:hypothetical protein
MRKERTQPLKKQGLFLLITILLVMALPTFAQDEEIDTTPSVAEETHDEELIEEAEEEVEITEEQSAPGAGLLVLLVGMAAVFGVGMAYVSRQGKKETSS